MALPTASDNAFTSLLITEGSAPASPAAGKRRLYVLSSDHLVYLKDSSGTVVGLTIGGYTPGGTDVAVADGGTGSSTASAARTALGLAIGTDVDAFASTISQAEAEAGSATTVRNFTAQRVAQAIAALGGGGGGATAGAAVNLGTPTTTSTTFVDVTSATATITTGAHRVAVSFTGEVNNSASNALTFFDVDVDGTRIGDTTNGLTAIQQNLSQGAYIMNGSFHILTDVLSAGSHTIKLQWRVDSGTGMIGSTVGGASTRARWSVLETTATT